MRILVTGGCGFIGGHLCHCLDSDGHGLVVLDDLSTGHREVLPASAEMRHGDVADPAACRAAMVDADACVHLAAIASVPLCQSDWARATDVNLKGGVNVFAAAAERGIPVVYASSAAVYGAGSEAPLRESDADGRCPLSNYGADKRAAELHAAAAGHSADLKSTGLRFFNVFGPGQDPNSPYSGVITIFARALMAGQAPTIFGDGGQSRDFIHVADVVRAIRAALNRAATDAPVFNVCTGRAVTLLTLYRTLAAVAGRHDLAPDFGPPRPGDIRHSRGDPRAAESGLAFRAEIDLAYGLRDLLSQT